MNSEFFQLCQKIEKQILDLQMVQNRFAGNSKNLDDLVLQTIHKAMESSDEEIKKRILQEFYEFGPLHSLFQDNEVTEIMVTSHDYIAFEKGGRISTFQDHFCSKNSYLATIERILKNCKCHTSKNIPMVDAKFLDFRLHLITDEVTKNQPLLTLRRHPENVWTLDRLLQNQWCTETELETLHQILKQKKSFLVLGNTGSGKTSVTNAMLHELPPHERNILIEDTEELRLPNFVSCRLLTRMDAHEQLTPISQSILVRQALRMRPDRIVLGEIRSEEAKDFLMALSTGHEGSFATLHANDPQQALIRLEMLVQMACPQWSLESIRRLLQLSLSFLIVCRRHPNGKRSLGGIYKVGSLESFGLLLEKMH